MLGNHVSSQKSNASKKHPKWQQSLNWQIQNKVKSKERKKIHKTRLPKITHTSPLIRARSWNWIIGSGFIHCRKDWNVLTFFCSLHNSEEAWWEVKAVSRLVVFGHSRERKSRRPTPDQMPAEDIVKCGWIGEWWCHFHSVSLSTRAFVVLVLL